MFDPHLEILPPAQRKLWTELSTVPPYFVLYGGTAISLQIGHRESKDFDFFADRELALGWEGSITFLKDATVVERAPNTLSVRVQRNNEDALVSFFGVPRLKRVEDTLIASGNRIRVASLIDLAASKMKVIQQRAEKKDYSDIDAILRRSTVTLEAALVAARDVYGSQFNPLPTLKALTFFEDGDLPDLPGDVKRRLAKTAARVDVKRLSPNYRAHLATDLDAERQR
jgi:hypothetical protein